MTRLQLITRVVKPALFVLALVPLATLVWDGFAGALGANPIETITHRTGDWTLRLLLITLAVTPLRRLSGWHELVRLRRMLGLYAFFYALLHFATYVWLDQGLNLRDILEDISKRPYVTLGFTAFLSMVPLALTSTHAMIRRLGGARWRKLHQLVYLAAVAGATHYLWLVKADTREPLIYLAILATLLGLRLPLIGRWHPLRTTSASR
jgi:sulfoxide reductase heme-binding subunit YedZ